jgi:K+-sensing histidine kinase KdpD
VSQLASKDLSELLALLAHDLRNPLAALFANINFLRSSLRECAPEIQEALSDSALSCTIVSQFLGNLDVVSRLLLDGAPASADVCLHLIASEAVARRASQSSDFGAEVDVEAGSGAPTIFADARWLARAVDNLLANSLQYAPARSKVSIEFATKADRGCLVILDDGPIVSAELRAWVFSAGAQGHAKHRFDARYGRGLGLFCAAEAARLAGAEVALGERAGRSVFELSGKLST